MKLIKEKPKYTYFNRCEECQWYSEYELDISHMLPCPECGGQVGFLNSVYVSYVRYYKRPFSLSGILCWFFGIPIKRQTPWKYYKERKNILE